MGFAYASCSFDEKEEKTPNQRSDVHYIHYHKFVIKASLKG